MSQIIGGDKLTAIFGRWPSFHDANILGFRRESTTSGEAIVIVVHVFRMLAELDERGYYCLDKHTKTVLRFHDCRDVQLNDFEIGIIFDLLIKENNASSVPRLEVTINSSYGLDGTLKCSQIEVVEAEPYIPQKIEY